MSIEAMKQAIERIANGKDSIEVVRNLARDAIAEAEKQEPVAFPRQAGDSTWTVDTAFIWRVKHTIDPDTPHDFTPSEEQIETVLLALEKIPSHIYTSPLQRQPLTDEQTKRWAVFCGTCRKEWSVPYQHPGKSVCDDCIAAHGIKENKT